MTTASPRITTKTPLWAKLLAIFFVLLLIAGAALGGIIVGKLLGATEERVVQVVRSVQVEEQVILLTAGIAEEIPLRGDKLNVFGFFDIPFTERAINVKFDFDGKFGIEGKDVEIEQTAENAYVIKIPRFEYLGYDNPKFSVANVSNGVLSWTTEEIDQLDAAEYALSDEAAQEHIDGFRDVLQVQAEKFYTRIVTGIDPTITLEFEFAQ